MSFHKYGEFFPGTGALDDIGYGKGKYYTVNVPLKDGMDDDSYKLLYEPIMQKVEGEGGRGGFGRAMKDGNEHMPRGRGWRSRVVSVRDMQAFRQTVLRKRQECGEWPCP